jgi:hypothetical protein
MRFGLGLEAFNGGAQAAARSALVNPLSMHGLSSTGWLRRRLVLSNARQNNWRTVWEFSDQRQVSPHGLDGFSKGGQQEITALFEARNTILGDTESLGHADLR